MQWTTFLPNRAVDAPAEETSDRLPASIVADPPRPLIAARIACPDPSFACHDLSFACHDLSFHCPVLTFPRPALRAVLSLVAAPLPPRLVLFRLLPPPPPVSRRRFQRRPSV